MPSCFLRFATIIAVSLTAVTTSGAQGVAPRAQSVAPMGMQMQPGMGMMERASTVDPDKKLSAGDQVTLEIVEDKEGGLARVVTAAGDLDVPELGRVNVAGKTTAEASGEIKRKLEADYYYHATVRLAIDRVSPIQVRSGIVYLSGEVRQVGPQEIVAGETLTLSNAILKAGGLTEWADSKKVKLMRQNTGITQKTEHNYKSIIERGDVKNDPVLQNGDRINVPKIFFRGF
ncbi:MAG: polysaccharide biosynthesis/export family protein [Bryobacteraceae bacterium]|nr:polysaccharide biosynthesis/export family protein [Bryobacteraceae bacterium]